MNKEAVKNENLKRSPIVVVVGHIDHGKTTLLDYIRKTNVAVKEAGGITQSIGAYEIVHTQTNPDYTQTNAENFSAKSALSPESPPKSAESARKITFIDTPGHEAFSKMRIRGAHIADIGILVIAGDEGIKPQTKEAVKALQDTKTPFIVAITKMDKPNVNLDKIKNDLTANNILLEGYGGNISYQPVSAKTGQGINELLDLILLTADVEDLKYNPSARARGYILESKMDHLRGITADIILEDGCLKIGDEIATESAKGKIKILENFIGQRVKEIFPSSPAAILGFENLPQVGEEFIAGKLTTEDLEKIKSKTEIKKMIVESSDKESVIRLILKADVAGSLEALRELIKKIPLKENQGLVVIKENVGEIFDGDVKDAVATNSVILGFRVRPDKTAENLARDQGVKIISSEIVYELVEAIEEFFRHSEEKEITGEFEVLAVFGKKSGKQIVGGKVIKGVIRNNARVEIRKGNDIIGAGKITNLQHNKKDVMSVEAGKECGILLNSDLPIEVEYHFAQQK